jgi:hypothetical protein
MWLKELFVFKDIIAVLAATVVHFARVCAAVVRFAEVYFVEVYSAIVHFAEVYSAMVHFVVQAVLVRICLGKVKVRVYCWCLSS